MSYTQCTKCGKFFGLIGSTFYICNCPIINQAPLTFNSEQLLRPQILARIANYVEAGSLWNPELMEHGKVRELLLDCQRYITAAAPPRWDSQKNRERCESPNGFNHKLDAWSTSDWFLAVLGELGEAANIAKKLNRFRDGIRGNKETETALKNKLRQELGDTFVYLDLIAQSLGFSIFDAGVEVFNAKSRELNCPILMVDP